MVPLFGTLDHGGIGFFCGLYFIACDDKIVYIGQSNYIPRRFLESFGPIYHQVADTKLPWSVAFAETNSDANELESTAIRKYAPVFNTSIPNKLKSQGIVPLIVGISPIFADQKETGNAFTPENLERQSAEALGNPNPPWTKGHSTRRSSEQVRAEREAATGTDHSVMEVFTWNEDTKREAMREKGASINGPLRFKINLIEDGSVIEENGEYLGTWELDENGFAYFTPDDENDVRLTDPFLGLLCRKIEDWHNEQEK